MLTDCFRRTGRWVMLGVLALQGVSGAADDETTVQPAPEEMAKTAGVKLPGLPWHVVNLWWDFEKPV